MRLFLFVLKNSCDSPGSQNIDNPTDHCRIRKVTEVISAIRHPLRLNYTSRNVDLELIPSSSYHFISANNIQ
jgi:hypothetical protein